MQNLSGPSNTHTTLFAIAGFIIGAVAWSGHLYTLLLLFLLPVLLPLAVTRVHFVALMAAYHAGATWTLVPGSHVFFGSAFRPMDSMLLWFGAIFVLTLPYAITRLIDRSQLYWTLPAALIIAAFLPTSIENPLTIAGALFPRLGWVGLLLTLFLYGAITRKPVLSLSFAAFLFAVCHLYATGSPQAPLSWTGVDTRFGGTGFVASNTMSSYEDAIKIQAVAHDSTASVTVFPETVVKSWNGATDLFWQPTFDKLASTGRTIVVGAEESGAKLGAYSNVLMIRGAQTAVFRQRVPIPIAMWHPFDDLGVPLNVSGPATITINGTRVAPIICYEQLLAFPVLDAMRSHPAIILGVANDYWARDTSIPQLQSSSLVAWSRLFWVPIVSAVNQ